MGLLSCAQHHLCCTHIIVAENQPARSASAPASQRILAMYPPCRASHCIASPWFVVMSASKSPGATESPTALCQAVMLPCMSHAGCDGPRMKCTDRYGARAVSGAAATRGARTYHPGRTTRLCLITWQHVAKQSNCHTVPVDTRHHSPGSWSLIGRAWSAPGALRRQQKRSFRSEDMYGHR